MTNKSQTRARRVIQPPPTRSAARQRAASNSGRRPPRRPAPPPRRTPRRRWGWYAAAAAAILAAAVGVTLAAQPAGRSPVPQFAGPVGPEGIPIETGSLLAPVSTSATGQMVDGIGCDAGTQVVYHVHTHLAVYVHGRLRPLPTGVGIVEPIIQQTGRGGFASASQCYYWLHVHAQDGVIHIESPSVRTYTLGQFFDIWHQPLSSTRVAGVSGRVTVFVNGERVHGNPRRILLGSHEDIQIDVGTPVVPPRSVDWSGTGL